METFKFENAKLLFFRFVVKVSVNDHITKKPLFADAAVRFLLVYFANFLHIVKLLYTSLNLLPWKQNSFVILFLQYLIFEGIILLKIIKYFASANYAQDTTDSNDNIAKFTEFPK